jgi:hypothetical protein
LNLDFHVIIIKGKDAERMSFYVHALLFDRNSGRRGNALFLILIAVALFAALSYAVTQTGRGGGSASREQTALMAAQIAQMGQDVTAAVQRMILTGTDPNALAFGAFDLTTYAWIPCTSGAGCVFAPDGGGAVLPQLPANSRDHAAAVTFFGPSADISQAYNILSTNVAVKGAGSDTSPDAYLQLGPITQAVCAQINQGLGLGAITPHYTFVAGAPNTLDLGFTPLQTTACTDEYSGGADFYSFMQVMVTN